VRQFETTRDRLDFDAVERAGEHAVSRYDAMVAAGETPSLAAMLATRKPPGSGIDDRLVMANAGSVYKQFENCPEMLEMYRKNYRASTGEDLPADAVVYRGLAQYPGDPGAVVTHKRSLQEVKDTMYQRGCEVHGDWEVHPPQMPPKPQEVRIGEDIVQRYMTEYRQEPGYERASDQELREEILHRHAPVVTADQVMSAPSSIEECNKILRGEA